MQTLSDRPMARRGISLIEVLMSIGVIAIGLLGVAALIPVAGHQAQEGIRNDRLASVGKRAFRELGSNGLLNPDRWAMSYWPSIPGLTPPPSPYGLRPLSWDSWLTEYINEPPPMGSSTPRTMPFPFIVDPMGHSLPFVSSPPTDVKKRQRSFVSLPWVTNPRPVKFFRLTLEPGAIAVPPDAGPPPAQIDEIFVFQDELDFEILKKANGFPLQTLLKDVAGNAAKRSSAGHFSWAAMFVPVDRRPLLSQPGGNRYEGPYEVSVIIFENRFRFDPPRIEKVQQIDGWGGGIATFPLPSTLPPPTDPLSDDKEPPTLPLQPNDVKKGQWILLAGNTVVPDERTGRPYAASDYKWYRIVAIDPGKAGYNWSMTLQGPDWKMAKLENSTLPDVWAIHMGNVVSVYTKTMYLERRPL